MLRNLSLVALLLAAPSVAAGTLRLRPGATTTLRLPENPSTGYSWRLDAAASSGLDHVALVDGGHRRGQNMPGAPGLRLWTIRALSPGTATLRFVYQRPWEPGPVETRSVDVEVAGK